MAFFAASPFLKALGWALLNSFWQFAICWLIWRTLTENIKKLTAAARHNIALVLLIAGTVIFVAGLLWKYDAAIARETIRQSKPVVVSIQYYTIWRTLDTGLDAVMPYWSLLYLISVIFLFMKFCLFVQRAKSIQNNGITKMNAGWRTHVKNISAQLGIQKEVKALLSVHVDTPQVIGFLKPVILLPLACLVNLSTEQLEAVLLHELVHVKRNDYVVNLFVTSAEILFFFNPFVKQMTAGIRREREYSCDDMVIQFQYHPHNYASALLLLEKNRILPVTYGIAASGKNQQQLLTRIERIMGIENRQTGFYRLGATLLALLLLGFVAAVNPASITVDNFGEVNIALAFTGMDTASPQSIGATRSLALAGKKIHVIPAKQGEKPVGSAAPVRSSARNNTTQHNQMESAGPEEDNEEQDIIQNASNKAAVDFALPLKDKPILRDAVTDKPDAPAEPYVPANSFSFQLTQDTAMPKMKGETYNERMATDARLKMQKAIEQINWQKIEKQLKYNRRDISKLKNEIMAELKRLNWQQINSEVKSGISQRQLLSLQDAVKQDHQLKQYRQYQQYQENEAYDEALTRQMAEQEQLLKDAAQQLEESRKTAEKARKKEGLALKKRRIIYI